MATLKINMKMTNPSNDVDFWENVLNTFRVVSPWAAGAYGFHVMVNKIFKYFSDGRDAELRVIVQREVQPKLDEMGKKIDHLSDLIFELKNKKS